MPTSNLIPLILIQPRSDIYPTLREKFGRIMWVMGHAIDNKYKLKTGSTAALRVDYD